MKKNNRISTGVAGLDEVLHGGLFPQRAYQLRGAPGSGKTTLGAHFLFEGARNGETSLFISLGETEELIKANMKAVSLDLSGVKFLDLSPSSDFFAEVESYDLFSPAEVEREPMTRQIADTIRELKPKRVFLDSITQFRYLSSDVFQYRKQVLSFIRFIVEQGATFLMTTESSREAPDDDIQFLVDGVIEIGHDGTERNLQVTKYRGSGFHAGAHDFKITPNGVSVLPRLIPPAASEKQNREQMSSGIPEVDELIGGGIERGTVTLISGPTGVGKTTFGVQFLKEAAGRGETSIIYEFEEDISVLEKRCENLNIPVSAMVKSGKLIIKKVEPLAFTAWEFANMVREDVEKKGAKIVMIDSIAGYKLSVKGKDLVSHLHSLCKYLVNSGIAVFLITEVKNITGDFQVSDIDVSYLTDNIIFIRYYENLGALNRAIGVLKKRLSNFEKTLREIQFTRYGIKVGRPITDLRGILKGTPEKVEEKNGQ
ncbi:MAG: ATPase domain-containing protein [Calditrichia bacterium]